MRTAPAISVVVPFFDSERYIGACVESLRNQQGLEGSYELIFVNNRSTDASASIVAQAPEIVVLEAETPGAYAARNVGVRRAQAPLIAFTDADCTVDRDWLRSIQQAMRDPSIAILVGHFRYPARASLGLRLLGAYENAKAEYVIDRRPPAQQFAYANNMAVRASVFEELGLFREWKRAADTELLHRLASHRPDLRVAYRRSMRITHLEFESARMRARRLSLYARTNSKIETFQELSLGQRIAASRYLLPGRRER